MSSGSPGISSHALSAQAAAHPTIAGVKPGFGAFWCDLVVFSRILAAPGFERVRKLVRLGVILAGGGAIAAQNRATFLTNFVRYVISCLTLLLGNVLC